VLIGIDMLAVQSPEGGDREAGRYGRQLVEGLLARDPVNRYVLYTHEGFPTARVPSSRSSLRVSMPPIPSLGPAGLRPTTQRLLDRNPEGLDWLILLDPFEPHYGGLPPESPLNGVRVASIVHDLAPALADDRRLVPLRRHGAVLAVSDATAAECRRRLGGASARVATIGVACDSTFSAPGPADPLSRVSGDELGRMGISGPFLLADAAGGQARANLDGIVDAYRRLPIEHRRRQRLVIAGAVADPGSLRAALYERGCEEGLVLVGEVAESSLRTLYGRCSAFLSLPIEEGSGQSIVEAMRSGAIVVAGRSGFQAEIVGDAGLLVDPTEPAEIAAELAELLSDADLDRDLRKKALARSARYSWDRVVEAVAATLGGDRDPGPPTRLRFDRGHLVRPRIAVFPDVPRDGSTRVDLVAQVPTGWAESYNVDLYLAPGDSPLTDGLPSDFGGFDARLFERNDGLIGYHAVVYRVDDAARLETLLDRLKRRPGLVLLEDDDFLDLIAPEPPSPGPSTRAGSTSAIGGPVGPSTAPAPGSPRKAAARHERSERAVARLRDLFQTLSRVVVRSPRHAEQVRAALPEFADQLAEVAPEVPAPLAPESRRIKARARLDLLPGALVIGQFGGPDGSARFLSPRAFRAILKTVPEAVLLVFDAGRDGSKARREARRLGIGGSYLQAGAVVPGEARDIVALLDMAIHPGGPVADRDPVTLADLLRAGVATVSLDSDLPASVVRDVAGPAEGNQLARAVRDLAADPAARESLGRSARSYLVGTPDPARASELLIAEVERCAAELPRVPGRRARRPAVALPSSPHFPRPASATDEATSRSR